MLSLLLNWVTPQIKRVKNKGILAEQIAADWLSTNQLKLIARNYHCKWGEIDIVALEHNTLCFIEVRYRQSASHGLPAETVTYKKQQRLIRSAQSYLQQHHKFSGLDARFDIFSLAGDINNPKIDWVKNAFMMSA